MVLCLSGLDPSGGAGIQADMEAILMTGSHCLPVITSLTVQNTQNVQATQPVNGEILRHQVESLLSDLSISAVKIGLLDGPDNVRVVAEILKQLRDVPVVADPVLIAGGGYDFGAVDIIDLYLEQIAPHATIMTPNTHELYRLSKGSDSQSEAADRLLRAGAKHVLVTGGHEPGELITNRLYSGKKGDEPSQWQWARQPGEYHGSGCTLAAALASYLAQGNNVTDAASLAQDFTWQAIIHGWQPGAGQFIPNRRYPLEI